MIAALAVFFAAYVAVTLAAMINFRGKLKKAVTYASRIAEGDFSERPRVIKGQFRPLFLTMDETAHRLRQKIRAANEEKNRILAILESMTEGVALIDADQKITLVNAVLAAALSQARPQLEGRLFWEIIRDPHVNDMIARALRERVTLRDERSILLSDSVFQIHVSPVASGDDFLGVVAVFYDVTKLKQLERIRSEFVANVSHELKTPLTSIIGYVETLKEGALDDRENRLTFLSIIEEHSRKLVELIEDLLFLSKMESGNDRPRKTAVDFGRLASGILRSLDATAKAKGVEVRVETQTTPFYIFAEEKSMERVFSNLIENAIKYNVEKGKVEVRATHSPEGAAVRVSDTGMGIAEPDLPRIFERFYRGEKSRSRESGGTGLGLSIAKHIVEKHDGRIEVESAPKRGTAFTVYLPAR